MKSPNAHNRSGFTPDLTRRQGAPDLSRGLFIGSFVYYEAENSLRFRDANDKDHPLNRLLINSEEWDLGSGTKNLPKPYLVGESGEVKEYGANVLYGYVNDTSERIAIITPVRDLGLAHLDPKLNIDETDYDNLLKKHLSRNNEKRSLRVSEDAQGNIIIFFKGKEQNGNVSVKILGDEPQQNGNLKLQLNGKFSLDMLDAEGQVYAQQLFDNTEGKEKIKLIDKFKNYLLLNETGTVIETPTIRIGKDETLKKILDDLLTAIKNMTHKHPQGPTIAVPINWAEFQGIKKRIEKFMDKQ